MTTRHFGTPIMHRVVERNGLVFVGGTVADDESLGMGGQTEEILAKFDTYLAEAGSDKTKLLSATIFVTDLTLKPELDAAWKAWIGPQDLPSRATVGVADLGGGTLIEITLVAHT